MSPEPDINITTLALCRLVLFALALKSAKPAYRLWRMYWPFRKRKPLAKAPPSPFANSSEMAIGECICHSLQRNGKDAAFACGECKGQEGQGQKAKV